MIDADLFPGIRGLPYLSAMSELVTLRAFDNAFEAHLLQAKLDSMGIPSYIFDENTVTINPLFNFLVGGIKVKVAEEHRERAEEVASGTEAMPYSTEDDKVILCPHCGSDQVYGNIRTLLLRHEHQCKNCGRSFSAETVSGAGT